MRKFLLGGCIAGMMAAGHAHAAEISRFDEICIAREVYLCALGASAGSYINMQVQSRNNRNARVRAQNATYLAKLRSGYDSGQTMVGADVVQNSAVLCETFIKALGDTCVVKQDIPTADEMRTAIRESNDAVLKTWLEALDARSEVAEPAE